MSRIAYKWCVVPQCISSTTKTPEKMFVSVPKDLKMRKQWLQAANRTDIGDLSNVFCCEDHFEVR